jgi:DNA-directed RNA polymerase subunit K/omega
MAICGSMLFPVATILAPTGDLWSGGQASQPRQAQDLYRLLKRPPYLGFLLVTIAASKDKKKSKRAAEEGFEVLIGPQKLTRFEKARIVGARSLQLAMGAPSFVPIDESIRDSIALAMTELASDALPISIRRSLPNGHSQDIPIKYLL